MMRNIFATLQKVRPMADKVTVGLRCHGAPASGITRRIKPPAHGVPRVSGSARA